MKPWEDLTEQGRYRRLRALTRSAIASYDLVPTRLRLVGGFTNVIYRVDTDGGPYAVRVDLHKDHTDADVDVEVAWLDALAAETDIDVCRIIRSREGSPYVYSGTAGVPGARRCVVQDWIPGVPLADRMTEDGYHRLGVTSASLHLHGADFMPPHRPMAWDRVFYWPEEIDPVVIHRPEHQHHFGGGRREVLDRALELTSSVLEDLDAAEAQIAHGDLHPWNVHVSRSRLVAFDFEDVMWAHPSQDIAITLYYERDHPGFADLEAAFEEGYRSIAPWPVEGEGELYHFMAARRLSFVNYVLNLDGDPEEFFESAFPQLERYVSDWG